MADQNLDWRSTELTPGRYELDLTRTCLSRGQVQITHRLMEALPDGPGELVLDDVHSEEPVTLTFMPPRTLSGLKSYFERHHLQPNDRLILTLTADGGLLDMYRRPPSARAQQQVPSEEQAAEREQARGASIVERLVAYGSSRPDRLIARQRESKDSVKQGRDDRLEPGYGVSPEEAPTRMSRQKPMESEAFEFSEPAEANPSETASASSRSDPEPAARPAPSTERVQPQQGSQDEVTVRILQRLEQPGAPAIIRVAKLAESLGRDPAAVETALEALARDEDSGVDKISSGIYRHSILTRSR